MDYKYLKSLRLWLAWYANGTLLIALFFFSMFHQQFISAGLLLIVVAFTIYILYDIETGLKQKERSNPSNTQSK